MTALHVDGPTGRYSVWVQRGELMSCPVAGTKVPEVGTKNSAVASTTAPFVPPVTSTCPFGSSELVW